MQALVAVTAAADADCCTPFYFPFNFGEAQTGDAERGFQHHGQLLEICA